MFPQILEAVGGDPIMWAVYVVLVTIALAFAKVIMTLTRVACLEIWARFTNRHRNSNNKFRKLIERSSHDDLRGSRLMTFRRNTANIPE